MKSALSYLLTAALTLPAVAFSQTIDYPAKPVRILVGYQAGGPTDVTARILAGKLQLELGQAFIVENKPGAGSNIASEQLATSAPDGYTLMVAASQMTWNSALYKSLKYDPVRSFEPISKIMTSPAVLVVSPNLPAKSIAELIAYAKKEPGKLNFASSGNGTVPHLNGELFKAATGIQMTHIPYRGAGPAVTDLLSGQVDMGFLTALTAAKLVSENKLRALAVVADKRLSQLPDVPTLIEAGVSNVDVESWNGLFAPAGTPPLVVKKLGDAVAKVMQQSDVRRLFEEQGAAVIGNSPETFRAEIQAEVQRSQAFVKSANLKLD